MTDERQRDRVLRVLLVDDNKQFAELLALELRTSGYEVRVANNGPMALQMALAQPPDVIMTDLSLPDMDGFELAKSLRAQLAPKNPVVIALTGCDRHAARVRSKAEGFHFHFVKPVEPSFLQFLLADLARNALGKEDPACQGPGSSESQSADDQLLPILRGL
jgi:CheY-like chemotaxis protein